MIRFALRVPRGRAELALAELLELSPGGVEETDLGEQVEYAIYGPPGELPALPELEAAVGDDVFEVYTSEVADDWVDRWKRFHRPVTVGGRVLVRAPWEDEPAPPGVIDVVIDPGRAFGTGAHATTRLTLQLLLELDARGPLGDVGCGSGVLAIAAAKLGWGPVWAVDNDPAAVEATRANAVANGVEVDVRRADVRTDGLPHAPVLAANLIRSLLLELAGALPSPPPTVIAGGMLAAEVEEIAGAFATRGLCEAARCAEGEWVALRLDPA